MRETKEESGYNIEVTGLIGIYQAIYPKINVSGPVFSAKVISGTATPSKEHPESIWVTDNELYAMAKAGKIFTKFPPFAVNHYLTRGPLTLDYVACDVIE